MRPRLRPTAEPFLYSSAPWNQPPPGLVVATQDRRLRTLLGMVFQSEPNQINAADGLTGLGITCLDAPELAFIDLSLPDLPPKKAARLLSQVRIPESTTLIFLARSKSEAIEIQLALPEGVWCAVTPNDTGQVSRILADILRVSQVGAAVAA